MEVLSRVKENWLTRKPHKAAEGVTVGMGFLLFGLYLAYYTDFLGWGSAMPASNALVFTEHQYWRLWTSLFVHADFGHLLGNAFLFLPFTFFLYGYFGFLFFPVVAVLMGGLINFIVLQTMPTYTYLVGISGVVYWMGAAYSVLYFLIDTRRTWRRRTAAVLFLTLVLFIPETYKPEVSYMSHFVGYVLGAFSGLAYYLIFHRKFKRAEELEYIFDDGYYGDEIDTSPAIDLS